MPSKYFPPLLLGVICSSICCNICWAAGKPLFDSKTPLQAVLSAPITQAYRQKKQDVRLYFDANFSYRENDVDHKLPLRIRTRGNYRRLNCDHPPLRLNFFKKENDNTLFEKQNKLKLVGACKNGKSYQELVALEYLVYQIWEAVSEYHFGTRLINLSYIDTDKKRKPWTSTTFVIEEIEDVAKRLNQKILEVETIDRQQLDLQQTALVELFQLLIGNSDYSTLTSTPGSACCHNVRLVADKDAATGIIPIPYDFDVSGLVNASYAEPAAQYPINSVRQRYFTGWCKEDRHFLSAIQRLNDRKASIYATVHSAGLLSEATVDKTTRYLDSFYTLINDDERVKSEIIGRCRGKLIKG